MSGTWSLLCGMDALPSQKHHISSNFVTYSVFISANTVPIQTRQFQAVIYGEAIHVLQFLHKDNQMR